MAGRLRSRSRTRRSRRRVRPVSGTCPIASLDSPGADAAGGFSTSTLTAARLSSEQVERIEALAIPPAWTDVWICPIAERPPAGDRPRRPRPQAVPLPPALARGPRRDQVRPHDRLRPGAAARSAAASRRDLATPGAAAREGAGHRRPPARDDADPRRQRGVRPGQRVVRPDHLRDRHVEVDGSHGHASSSAARAAVSTTSS